MIKEEEEEPSTVDFPAFGAAQPQHPDRLAARASNAPLQSIEDGQTQPAPGAQAPPPPPPPPANTFITHNPETWQASVNEDRAGKPSRARKQSQMPKVEQEYTPVAGMSMADYTASMRYRPLASAASRPQIVTTERDRGKRAKTGCYTCRKRRIKCDERLPTCRNCEKGHRECRGYDPNNRPDPAWNSLPSSSALSKRGSQDPTQPSSPLGAKRKRDSRALKDAANKKVRASEWLSSSVIDPALSDAAVPSLMAGPSSDAPAATGAAYNPAFAQDVSAHVSALQQNQHPREKRELRIEDLYLMGGADPPTPRVEQPLSDDAMNELKMLYAEEYAPGLDDFLETRWYSERGLFHLLDNDHLVEMFAGMAEIFRSTKSGNFEVMHKLPSTEARVVWHLVCLARHAAVYSDPEVHRILPPERTEVAQLVARLAVFEHLITNKVLPVNPVSNCTGVPFSSVQQSRLHRFWTHLGDFVAAESDEKGNALAEKALASMRGLLDSMETRDVLYSIAIARYYGAKTDDFPNRLTPGTHSIGLHAADKNKLIVATKFLENEASGGGTNQVIQRFCGMARRGWAWMK